MATATVARSSGYRTPETEFYSPPFSLDRHNRGPVFRSQPPRPPIPPIPPAAPVQTSNLSTLSILNRLLLSQAQTFGPAYRYPAAGWIYLHIEGEPYERGYQHGHLMSREIPEYLERCAAVLGSKNQWDDYRTTANALFLRGFNKELMEEMRGIADGASDAGARWKDRRIDLLDIVVANTTVEMGELGSAAAATPTGLEGLSMDAPPYSDPRRNSAKDHCSAFAATGPATRDGKMVIGHVTWWPLTQAEQTNVMLDIKPASGHRVLLQSYPGGISIAAGAQSKTARLVPQINRYFVAVPQTGDSAAAIQVFQPLNFTSAAPAAPSVAQPVHAPWALQLEFSTLSEHPDLRKMGLHAVPPGGTDSVIIANANTSRIGVKSSAGDLDAVREGKTYCAKKDDGAFYNLKLPLEDAAGRRIGILVMEIPFTSAANETEAIARAEKIRGELARQISTYDRLFQ